MFLCLIIPTKYRDIHAQVITYFLLFNAQVPTMTLKCNYFKPSGREERCRHVESLPVRDQVGWAEVTWSWAWTGFAVAWKPDI